MPGVHGRLDDMLIIKGVNVSFDVEAVVPQGHGAPGEYRLVVERVEHLDRLTIEIEHLRGCNRTTEALSQRIASRR
jgi:phenylacetate-CoA ligase